jgi:DNA-binding response OmpR family regulator
MDDVAPHVIFEFEGFELDPRRGLLRRRGNGHELALSPKAFAALVYLVERSPVVFTSARQAKAADLTNVFLVLCTIDSLEVKSGQVGLVCSVNGTERSLPVGSAV